MNRVQKLRKTAGVNYEDKVAVFFQVADGAAGAPQVLDAVGALADFIRAGLRIDLTPCAARPDGAQVILEEANDVEGEQIVLYLVRLQ